MVRRSKSTLILVASHSLFQLAQLGMSVVMLSYGAKLVRDERVAGSDLLAFVIYQLTLGSVLSVNRTDR